MSLLTISSLVSDRGRENIPSIPHLTPNSLSIMVVRQGAGSSTARMICLKKERG